MANLEKLLDRMWEDYVEINPQASQIHALLEARGEKVLNDHIALRTFRNSRIGLENLARVFTRLGYEPRGDYDFPEKKLTAKHYEHSDETMPKVFISEQRVEELSPESQEIISRLVNQVPAGFEDRWDFPVAGRPWTVTLDEYETLAADNEYSAWMAAHGFRPNHFTVNVNALSSFPDLQSLNEFLKEQGFRLNASGGEIKGTPDVYLEQSSTMASRIPVKFADGESIVPGCYYEFARRYPMTDGRLYQGFVAKSADKIFESTNRA